MILVHGEEGRGGVIIHRRCPRLPQPAIVGASRRSPSTSWVLSVFSEMWRRRGKKRNKSSTAHITGGSRGLSASVSRIPKGKNTHRKESRYGVEKDPPHAFKGACTICCYPNIREHWFPRNWIWRAIFFHFTLSSVCLRSRYWNPSSAALFPSHLEGAQRCCQPLTMFSTLSFSTFPSWSTASLFNVTSVCRSYSTLLSGTRPPSFFTFDLFPLKWLCFPASLSAPCRRKVALLRRPCLNSFFQILSSPQVTKPSPPPSPLSSSSLLLKVISHKESHSATPSAHLRRNAEKPKLCFTIDIMLKACTCEPRSIFCTLSYY